MRNLDAFHRFLEVAALTDGEIINNNNIAQECGVHATTVNSYFDILEDTLIGYRIPAYTKVMQRRLVQAPRFYYFDIGITNHLLHRKDLMRGTADYGHAFEHLVVQELVAYLPVFRAPLPQILNYPKNQAVVCRKVGKVSDPC